MKHLKKYKLFEYASLDINDWLDVKDIIQSEILDKYHISIDDVVDKNAESKYVANDPELFISYNNLEMSTYIIDDIYDLNERIYSMTKHFIIAKNNVNSSKRNIEVKLSKVPDARITINHFNLEETYDFDNVISKGVGGFCDYETAVKILEWLKSFYGFYYKTELDAFKLAYDTLEELYNVDLIFSMPKFEDKNYSQVVCFNFLLSSDVEKIITNEHPIFVINTNRTYSPYILQRRGGSGWHEFPYEKKERYIDFLKTEQF
jgi:hypothetical protein